MSAISTQNIPDYMNSETTMEEKEYSTEAFIMEYMNDHNGGTPRWLRSAFIDEKEKIETILEFMRGIEAKSILAIQHRDEELRKVVEGMKPKDIPWTQIDYSHGYIQALDDILRYTT